MPWSEAFFKAFHDGIADRRCNCKIYFEYLDADRFRGHLDGKVYADFLKAKYRDRKIDLLVLHVDEAVDLLIRNPDLFAGAHTIALVIKDKIKASQLLSVRPADIYLARADIAMSFDHMMKVYGPKNVMVVGSRKTSASRDMVENLEQHLATRYPGLSVEREIDTSLDLIQKRVGQVSPTSAIFYLPIYKDKGAGLHPSQKHLQVLSRHASAPIFTYWDTMLDAGATGGLVLSAESLGRNVAVKAQKVLSGDLPEQERDDTNLAFSVIYDDARMRKFGIRQAALPGGAQIVNLVSPFWVEHRLSFLVFISVLGLGSLWIVTLRRRIRAKTRQLLLANRKLSKLSNTDPLTGLANRRRFDEMIAHECARSGRMEQALALAMIDIDHFKAYNDLYGHQAGDECLKKVADTIQSYCRRAGDMCARYGGEEFVLISVGNNIAKATRQLEALRVRIEELAITHEGSDAGVVTISVGVSVMQSCFPYNSKELIMQSDQALYRAKHEGRNKVECSAIA